MWCRCWSWCSKPSTYRRVGKEGYDKNLKLNDMIEMAYTMDNPRPNIIIKAGKMLNGN